MTIAIIAPPALEAATPAIAAFAQLVRSCPPSGLPGVRLEHPAFPDEWAEFLPPAPRSCGWSFEPTWFQVFEAMTDSDLALAFLLVLAAHTAYDAIRPIPSVDDHYWLSQRLADADEEIRRRRYWQQPSPRRRAAATESEVRAWALDKLAPVPAKVAA